MKDKVFIDTNVLVYANDKTEKNKHEQAKQILVNGIVDENIALSAQVLSEFYVTVTRKIQVKLPENIAKKEILLMRVFEIVDIDFHLIIQAVDISNKNGLSFWDSLIVAAALKAKCNVLYSEDLNHNHRIDSVTIINPFII
jgi:predicted nucleic acid-binding protein